MQLLSHPEYPTLKSITDTLDYFSIENLAVKMPKDSIDKLPESFIAFLNKNELVLVKRKKKYIIIINENLQKEKVSYKVFNEAWTGNILALERNKFSFVEKQKSTLLIFWICVTIFSSLIFLNSNLTEILFFFFSLLGVFISVLIIKKELGYDSTIADRICNIKAKNSSCEEVLHSNENKIFNFFNLSDLGVLFFFSMLLITLFNGFNYLFFSILLYLSLGVVLITIYRQLFVLKRICPLCLLLGTTIILMNFILVFFTNNNYTISMTYLYKSFTIITLSYSIWFFFKPILKSHFSINELRFNFQKFKQNFTVFETLLYNQPKTKMDIKNKISVGANNPQIELDVITNPLCGYCKKSFEVYRKLLDNKYLKEHIKINFIFYTSIKNDNPSKMVSKKLIEAYKLNGDKSFINTFKNWFEVKNIEQFLNGFSEDKNIDTNAILLEHYNWCKKYSIKSTPKTLINGYAYPSSYDIEDLSFFINELLIRNQNKSFRERLT